MAKNNENPKLYPLTVGCRYLELADAYTPGDAVITLTAQDYAIVPPGPNLLTICHVDDATKLPYIVTVRYTDVVGLRITGLTVVEADTPESYSTHRYPAGSRVSRPLTRNDIQAIHTWLKNLQATKLDNQVDPSLYGKVLQVGEDGRIVYNDVIGPTAEQSDWEQDDRLDPAYIRNKPFKRIGDGLEVSIDGTLSATAVPEHVKPNWWQDDESKPDAIINRPFRTIGLGLRLYQDTGVLTADNADWDVVHPDFNGFIRNKPFQTIGKGLYVESGALCATGGEGPEAQSDWNETDDRESAYIRNKPFQRIGDGLTVRDGVLSADAAEIDNADWNINDPNLQSYIRNKPFQSIGAGLHVADDGALETDPVPIPEQVQSDWEQLDETQKDYIKSKPFQSIGEHLEVANGVLSAVIPPYPEQVQSDWGQMDPETVDYIKSKPFQSIGDGLTVTDGVLSALPTTAVPTVAFAPAPGSLSPDIIRDHTPVAMDSSGKWVAEYDVPQGVIDFSTGKIVVSGLVYNVWSHRVGEWPSCNLVVVAPGVGLVTSVFGTPTPHTEGDYSYRIWNDPSPSAISYGDDAVDMPIEQRDWLVRDHIHPAVVTGDGQIAYYLNPYDLSRKLDGSQADLTGGDGDVMLLFEPIHWVIQRGTEATEMTVAFTWKENAPASFPFSPHMINSEHSARFVGVGIFEGYVADGKLRSVLVDAPPTGDTTQGRFYELANAGDRAPITGSWNITTPSVRAMIQILVTFVLGTRDSQSAVGYGIFAPTPDAIQPISRGWDPTAVWQGDTTGTQQDAPVTCMYLRNLWGNVTEILGECVAYDTRMHYQQYLADHWECETGDESDIPDYWYHGEQHANVWGLIVSCDSAPGYPFYPSLVGDLEDKDRTKRYTDLSIGTGLPDTLCYATVGAFPTADQQAADQGLYAIDTRTVYKAFRPWIGARLQVYIK